MANLNGKYAVVGVGTSRFGKLQGVSTMGFTLEASKRAIADAGIARDAIDGVLVMMPAIMGEQHGWAARVAAYLGIEPTFSATLDMGGATACGSVQTAMAAIDAGYCTAVLCCFATQNWPQGVAMQLFGSDFQVPYGDVGAITLMAHIKRRQQYEHGFTDEHYGKIAVTWREHAMRNPDAQMKKPITLDDYLKSRWVAEPLRLFDCCPNTDGGGACIVTSLERARDLAKPPARILGAGQSHSSEMIHPHGYDREHWGGKPAAALAFGLAGVTPKDIDVAQFYDAFTPRVIHDLVAYGFCQPDEVGGFIHGGNLSLTGSLPSNTAGGLISEGHLSGFGHIREGVRQIRGECGARQVKDAELCLVTGYGGAPHEAPPTVSYSALVLGR
ncbi:MAG TPA: thiolase family protein [Candidatus Binatia bacterium]|nr:thiolase family protein [Candidatus Binatia bacterium]